MKKTRNKALKRIIHVLAWIAILGNVALLFLLSYWLLVPYQTSNVVEPIEILNENDEVAIGSRIQMRIQIDKRASVTPSVNVFITCEDGNLITLTSLARNLPVGQYVIVNDSYVLPPKALPGSRCQFNFLNTYKVNPIRSITKQWTSETFTVTK